MNLRTLQEQLRSGTATSEALVSQSFARIAETQTDNAFLSLRQEQALAEARAIDARRAAGEPLGSLAGIPIAVKDNICVVDSRCSCGSHMLENFTSPYDATAVTRLKAAGAVIVGKTNMDEFAMGSSSETSFFGPVRNPRNPDRIPGGSSGGSAVAVANGSVPLSLGSDTGGSIRQPAACCGVVGLKPTYGRVSRYGLVAYASSLDQIGPFAQTVADAGELLQAISGHDDHDCTSSRHAVDGLLALLDQDLRGVKIGIPAEYFGEGLDPHHRDLLMGLLEKMRAEGALLQPVKLPSMEHAVASYYILATAEASSNLSRFDGVRYTHRAEKPSDLNDLYRRSRAEGFGDEVKRRILLGTFVLSSGYYDAYYMQAQKVRRLINDDFKRAFESCDLIAAPVLPTAPMRLGEGLKDPLAMYLSDIYTVSVNLAGLPGLTVPVGEVATTGSTERTSTSIQFIGKPFDEARLLQLGAAAERLRA